MKSQLKRKAQAGEDGVAKANTERKAQPGEHTLVADTDILVAHTHRYHTHTRVTHTHPCHTHTPVAHTHTCGTHTHSTHTRGTNTHTWLWWSCITRTEKAICHTLKMFTTNLAGEGTRLSQKKK